MQRKRRLWPLFLLSLVAVIAVLAFRPKTSDANTYLIDKGYGVHGYLRQSTPITLKARVQSVKATANAVLATLCIRMPSLEPWNPYATLRVDGKVIPNSGFTLLNAKSPNVMKSATRCYEFTFPYKVQGTSVRHATIRLENLWLELGRGYWDERVVAEINRRAQKFAPGLDFVVVHERGKNGGGAYIRFRSLPAGMSQSEAASLIQHLSIDEILVNWQAEVTLK